VLFGEGVHGTGIVDLLPVDLGGIELGDEGLDVGLLYERIGRTVEDEHLRLDVLAVGRTRRVEAAMEAHDAIEVGACTRQLEHRGTAKAVADRGDMGRVDLWLREKLREVCLQPLAQLDPIGLEPGRRIACLFAILGSHGHTVDIGDHRHIAKLGQHCRPRHLIVGRPHVLMHDQHCRELATADLGRVEDHLALVGLPVGRPAQRPGLHVGPYRRRCQRVHQDQGARPSH